MKLTLLDDTSERSQLKSLYKNEEKYADYLEAVEYSIAVVFQQMTNLRDSDIIKILEILKKDHFIDFEIIQHPVAKVILYNLSDATAEASITHHELDLVYSYIIWAIDNRTWLGDKQAYLKWISYSMNLMSDEEEGAYVQQIESFGRKHNIGNAQIDVLLLRSDNCIIDKNEEDETCEESELFAKKKLGRNEPCHCGSEKKYKKCCLDNDLKILGREYYF